MAQSLNNFIIRASIFLVATFVIVVLLYPVLQNAFLSNIFINIIILLALVIGIVFNLFKLIGLNTDYIALANFDINKSPQSFLNNKGNLKNLEAIQIGKETYPPKPIARSAFSFSSLLPFLGV